MSDDQLIDLSSAFVRALVVVAEQMTTTGLPILSHASDGVVGLHLSGATQFHMAKEPTWFRLTVSLEQCDAEPDANVRPPDAPLADVTDSPAIRRVIDEMQAPDGQPVGGYNRTYNRHNR